MIEIQGIRFNVDIKRKKIKNMYLRLEDTTIRASVPFLMPEYKVYQFIEKKRDWVYKAYLHSQNRARNSYMYRGGNEFCIFGERYRLVRTIGRSKVEIEDKTINLVYKDDSENGISYLYKHLDRLLLKKTMEFFEKYRHMLTDYGYMQIPEFKTRIMKSKWGVCYTQRNKIGISSYLIHFPMECLEYIVVHELTHFIVPNHSKRFYEIVKANMPSYPEANSKLRQ